MERLNDHNGEKLRMSEPDYNAIGNLYWEQGEFEKAIAEYRKALKVEPKDYGAWSNIGIAYYMLGELKTALNAFKKAVDINPRFAKAWQMMGLMYGKLGKFKEAIKLRNLLFEKSKTLK